MTCIYQIYDRCKLCAGSKCPGHSLGSYVKTYTATLPFEKAQRFLNKLLLTRNGWTFGPSGYVLGITSTTL